MAIHVSVLSADTHLAERAWAKHPGLCGDSYYGLSQIVDYCCQHELDLVLAGDIFDKNRPDPLTMATMRHQIDRMERQNLDLFYNTGQHERSPNETWMNAVSWWPTHIDKTSFMLGPINCYGLDWTSADQVKQELDKIPVGTDMFIAHQVWRDLMGPRIGESECAFADVPNARIILTGDFHRHLNIKAINRDTATTCILSPGPVCMQSIDEDPRKSFFVISDDMSVHSESLRTRQCFRFSLMDQSDLETFLTDDIPVVLEHQVGVPDNIAKNIVHITYKDDIPEVYARLTSAVGSGAHLFMVPVRQQQEVVTIETSHRRALAEGGMEACLELLTEKDGPLYQDTMALLHAPVLIDQLKTIKALRFK